MKTFAKKHGFKLLALVATVAVVWGWQDLAWWDRSRSFVYGYGSEEKPKPVVNFGWGGWGGGGWGWVPIVQTPTNPQVELLETWWPATWSNNTGSSNTGSTTPETPRWDAYTFAKENGITSMPTYETARMDNMIVRAEVAKIVVQFYKNVLKKDVARIDQCNPANFKDYDGMDTETRWFVRDVCSIGVMGWKNNKATTIEYFKPYNYITRAEVATVLSRMIYNTESTDVSDTWYLVHMNVLVKDGILPNTSGPMVNESRGNVFQMIMKASK
jgi:hypothetical protein